MLPDLLSLSDPFGGSMEESAKGVCALVFDAPGVSHDTCDYIWKTQIEIDLLLFVVFYSRN